MAEVLQNTQLDESRILTEAAVYADKVAVDEETVRLRSHLSQLDHMLAQEGPVGRKLDFLIQEFNREANTIGSKCNDIETAGYVWISRPRSRRSGNRSRTSSKAVRQDEAYQYRIWKHGFRRTAHRHCQPGVGPHQAHGPGGPGPGCAH